jgi:hypothetical protein
VSFQIQSFAPYGQVVVLGWGLVEMGYEGLVLYPIGLGKNTITQALAQESQDDTNKTYTGIAPFS